MLVALAISHLLMPAALTLQVVTLKLMTRNILFKHQILSCQQVLYYTLHQQNTVLRFMRHIFIVMLGVIMLSVVVLGVVAPNRNPIAFAAKFSEAFYRNF
jgi:hypothetical protein